MLANKKLSFMRASTGEDDSSPSMDMSRETGELADYQLVGEFANNMLVTLPAPQQVVRGH